MTSIRRVRYPKFSTSLTLLAGTIGAWMLGAAIEPTPAAAQLTYNTADVFDDVRDSNERDPLMGGSDIDMMDLIHRANLSGGRSLAEFIGSQSMQIQNVASDFRTLQLQRLYQSEGVETPNAVSLDLSE